MGLREDVAALATRVADEVKTKAPSDHLHTNYVDKSTVTINGKPLEGDVVISDGERGPSGVIVSDTKPVETDILWVNLNEEPPASEGAANSSVFASHVPSGSRFQVTISNNSSVIFGNEQGREYAVGISFGDVTVDMVKIECNTAASAGSLFRVGFRPIGNDGSIGAPVIDAEFPIDLKGALVVTLPAPVRLRGNYTMSWVRIGDVENVMRIQRSQFEQNMHLFPMQFANLWTATGHGPVHVSLNSGITGALPTTVTMSGFHTNVEGGGVPQVEMRVA